MRVDGRFVYRVPTPLTFARLQHFVVLTALIWIAEHGIGLIDQHCRLVIPTQIGMHFELGHQAAIACLDNLDWCLWLHMQDAVKIASIIHGFATRLDEPEKLMLAKCAHSKLGYQSPLEFERELYRKTPK